MPRASETRSAEGISHNSVDHVPKQLSLRDAEADSDAESTDADTREDGNDAYTNDSDSSNTPFSVADTPIPHMASFRENVKILPAIASPLPNCKGVLDAFLKARFSLKTKEDNRLRYPPTIAGESDKWIMTKILGSAIAKGDVLPSKVKIATKVEPTKGWSTWVATVSKDKEHKDILDDVSILRAVQISAKFHVSRNNDDLGFLIQRWSTISHTFFASWGEFTPTLEDVHVLLKLSALGDFDITSSQALPPSVIEVAKSLKESPKTNYPGWIKRFFGIVDKEGTVTKRGPMAKSPLALPALISFWLDRYVFPGPPHDNINPAIFTLAALLASGRRLPLAPLYLGTLYSLLDQL